MRLPFIQTISENIRLRTVALILKIEMIYLKGSLLSIFSLYNNSNFNIVLIDVDLKFECVKLYLLINTNIIDKDSHMYLAKRYFIIVKERCRFTAQNLLFSMYPKILALTIVFEVNGNLNRLIRADGITKYLSLLAFVTRSAKLDYNLITLSFSNYIELYENNKYQRNSLNT